MGGNYEPDTFTELDVKRELDAQGLKWYDKGRYILSQCPTHEDKHPSVQIYKDDWFVNCHATCARYHITKAFPSLRPDTQYQQPVRQKKEIKKVVEKKYTEYNLIEEWEDMEMIPRDHVFKGLDLHTLDELGWRWIPEQNAYFIPYWNRPRTKIPFAQYRYLSGDVRFRFLKDAKPTMYGTWNLEPGNPIFVVEGTSDGVVLDEAMIPWIAMPSASSAGLVEPFAKWCIENDVQIIYAGDRDAAGDKLKDAFDAVAPYRVWQVPEKYKDWGEFFEAEGLAEVIKWCNKELNPEITFLHPQNKTALEILGGTELEVSDSREVRKEPSEESDNTLF